MKLALATCAPGPARLAYMFAVPRIASPPAVATVVRPGGLTIHSACPSASVIAGSYVNVSPATTTSCTIGQIAGQSPTVASRISVVTASMIALSGTREPRGSRASVDAARRGHGGGARGGVGSEVGGDDRGPRRGVPEDTDAEFVVQRRREPGRERGEVAA